MAFKCDKCDKEFNSDDALSQHTSSKHSAAQNKKYMLYAFGGALVLFAIIYFAFLRGDNNNGPSGNFASDDFVLQMSPM